MVDFKIKLADIPIAVSVNYESTKNHCRDYITDEEPLVAVAVSDADIKRERDYSVKEEEIEGLAHAEYSDSYLETLALYRAIVEKLIPYGVLLFHGAGVESEGKGVLFTAKSGTGKTTHIRLWYELTKERNLDFDVVNGDKPLLRIVDGKVIMYGTPWQGKESYGKNTSIPLDSIVVLGRSETNEIHPITPIEAMPYIFQQSYRPQDRALMSATLKIIGEIAKKIKFYKLSCNMEKEAAEVSYSVIMMK